MKNEKTKKLLSKRQFIAVLIIIVAASFIPSRFSVTITPSLSKRIFFISRSPAPDKIKKGDYVIFNIAGRYPGKERPKSDLALKRISCVEGEFLDERNKEYFCNHEYLGKAKDISLKGQPLTSFHFNGPVPQGEVFVTAEHKDSFDSRYFGFVDKGEIFAQAYPLF